MALDLAGDNPQGRMMLLISSTDNKTMSCGVDAFAKRSGVISFTRLSVHCALSRTAINSADGHENEEARARQLRYGGVGEIVS